MAWELVRATRGIFCAVAFFNFMGQRGLAHTYRVSHKGLARVGEGRAVSEGWGMFGECCTGLVRAGRGCGTSEGHTGFLGDAQGWAGM